MITRCQCLPAKLRVKTVEAVAPKRVKDARAGAHSLDKIASKYHSRMRTVHASSDSLSEGVVVPALREAIVEGRARAGQPPFISAGREAIERKPHGSGANMRPAG
jgi:hypothetical protein